MERRDNIRGNLSLEQMEAFHFVSSAGLLTARRQRLHTKKSWTSSTCIPNVPLPDIRNDPDIWKMSFKDKKQIYGCARILPSGRVQGDADLTGTGITRQAITRKDR